MKQISTYIFPAMETIIRNQRNYQTGSGRESSDKPSQTVPGETYSIAEIMKRAMEGMPPEQRQYPYLDEEDLERIDSFFNTHHDLTDLDEYKERILEMRRIVNAAIERREAEQAEDTQSENDHDQTEHESLGQHTQPEDE